MLTLSQIRILVTILLCITLFSLSPQIPHSALLGEPFGGRITAIYHFCNLSQSSWMVISNPIPRTLSYQYGGSQAYQWGPPRNPGQSLLGNAAAPYPCVFTCPAGACTLPTPGELVLFTGSTKV